MIKAFTSGPMRFWRGRNFYEIAHAYDGAGFIGLRDGRVIARADDKVQVLRRLLE